MKESEGEKRERRRKALTLRRAVRREAFSFFLIRKEGGGEQECKHTLAATAGPTEAKEYLHRSPVPLKVLSNDGSKHHKQANGSQRLPVVRCDGRLSAFLLS